MTDATEGEDVNMSNGSQMFDWIFFAIVFLPLAYVILDWLRGGFHNYRGLS